MPTPSTPLKKKRFSPRAWFQNNPVVLKEMRSRMRGGRSFWTLSIHVGVLSVLVLMIYSSISSGPGRIQNQRYRQELGQTIFFTVVGIELLAICIIAPSLTAGAIASERERKTFDLLRTTTLSASSLVLGKLVSVVSFLFLLLFAALPLQSIAFIFGGVTSAEFILSLVFLIVTTVSFSAVGLFFSSFTRRARISTVLSQSAAMLLVFGVPLLLVVLIIVSDVSSSPGPSATTEALILIAGWIIVAINPLGAAIATEIIYVEEQTLLMYTTQVSRNLTMPVISPWIGFIIFYTFFTLLLIWLSIRFVRRTAQ